MATGTATKHARPAFDVVPANEAAWDDLQAVFGTRGDPAGCWCQWFKIRDKDWRSVPRDELRERFREQTGAGHPDAATTSGLVAYLHGEPAGWCAVEPRTHYLERMSRMRVPWRGREEDPQDPGVWAVTCFVTRTGFRRRGVSRALTSAAVDYARERDATALEAYPMVVPPDAKLAWGELYVGNRTVFDDAGFREVSRPTPRRVVMRVDFTPATPAAPTPAEPAPAEPAPAEPAPAGRPPAHPPQERR
jgi:GNAT superfamily N-acetyltransferase